MKKIMLLALLSLAIPQALMAACARGEAHQDKASQPKSIQQHIDEKIKHYKNLHKTDSLTNEQYKLALAHVLIQSGGILDADLDKLKSYIETFKSDYNVGASSELQLSSILNTEVYDYTPFAEALQKLEKSKTPEDKSKAEEVVAYLKSLGAEQ